MAATFRAAGVSDLAHLAAVEAQVQATPWTLGNFRDSLDAGHRLLIAEEGGELVGYVVASLVLDEAELLTIGVPLTRQGRGYGAALLTQLLEQARAHGACRMFLEVREGNAPAHNLYRRFGFAEIGRRRGYYAASTAPGGREDALVMALELKAGE